MRWILITGYGNYMDSALVKDNNKTQPSATTEDDK